MDWEVLIGGRKLAMVESIEIIKSVDALADTCRIILPGAAYGKAYRVENEVKRGQTVKVGLGYNRDTEPEQFRTEFEGYVLSLATDDGSLTITCEDGFFLLRKAVKDKSFKATGIKAIAEYVVAQTGAALEVDSTLGITYEKFVISHATGYDVLKKLKEETHASIYVKDGKLCIHPPYIQKGGEVVYSFQQNIEASDLKYVRKEDKKIEVVVTATNAAGKKEEVRYGTTGGDAIALTGNGMDKGSMKKLAEVKWRVLMTDGYDGDITAWLVPYVAPTYTAKVRDEDYEYKDGSYYVVAVTTTFNSSGGARKVTLGIRVGGANG